jgi:ATP-binding cassette subfamily C protein
VGVAEAELTAQTLASVAASRPGAGDAIGFLPSLGRFMGDLNRYARRESLVAGALVAVGALVESLGLVLLIPLLGVVAPSTQTPRALRRIAEQFFGLIGAHSPFERLAALLAIYAVLMVFRAVVTTLRDVKMAALQIGFLESQRAEVADLLAAARWDQLVRLRHARITQLMSGDLQRVATGVTFLLQAAVALVMMVSQIVLAFVVSPALASIALALLIVIGLALAPMVRRSQGIGRFVTESNLKLVDVAAQFLGGLKLAVSQNLQGAFTREFRDTLQLVATRQVDNIRQRTYARLLISLLSSAVGGAIVLIGFGVLHVPASVLIWLVLIISRMNAPVSTIQQGLQQVAFALPAYDQVVALKAELASVSERRSPSEDAPFPEGAVVFEAVSFRHPSATSEASGERGVQGIGLTLRPGDFLGVVGASGAGKTTFADLLVGLIPPQQGRITVGGCPLAGAVLAGWRGGVSYVSQDPFLFHDTVRRNLTWACPSASEADLWRALALADAEALVRRMDLGLDAVVGERGALVSGGERQRIALARAVLRRPRVLVLDEATNAIDIPTERLVLERICALLPQPTIVMIAHRPESLALCRTVVEIEDGRLVRPAAQPGPALAG